MKTAVVGGVAAFCLAAIAASAGAQIHNGPVVVYNQAHATSSAPRPHPVGAAVAPARHGGWRAHRFHDCMKRYGDRKGCYYLAWHKHAGHGGHAQGR